MLNRDALGIDTSNYTTSAARLTGDEVSQNKRLLTVREGEGGLRQNDAVFQHVRQLPDVLSPFAKCPGHLGNQGYRTVKGRGGVVYALLLVGMGTARVLSETLGVPLYCFPIRQGILLLRFIRSDGWTCWRRLSWRSMFPAGQRRRSGCTRRRTAFTAERVASSLDLKAGQAVDRCGLLLGLPFPAGACAGGVGCPLAGAGTCACGSARCGLFALRNRKPVPGVSGIQRAERWSQRYCLEAIRAALEGMCAALLRQYGTLPVVFAGGVASNSILREALSEKYGAQFASPAFSADNAAGLAVLAGIAAEGMLMNGSERLPEVLTVSQLNFYVRSILDGDPNCARSF